MSRVDVNNQAPPRIPKLKVRNRTPFDQSSISTSSSGEPSDPDAITSIPSRDQLPLASPTLSDSSRSTLERTSSASTTLASNASTSRTKPQKKIKKKGASVLGFLTLKEPSQTALEEFAERTRKQAAEKAGTGNIARASAVGLHGVSTQKLPSTVPKVNSKWDGVPETAKAREAAARKSFMSMSRTRDSTSLQGPYNTKSSNGSWNPPNSLASSSGTTKNTRRPPSLARVSSSGSGPRDLMPRFANRPVPVVPVFDPAAAGLKTRTSLKSPSTSSLPEITYFFPTEIDGSGGVAAVITPLDNQPTTPKCGSPSTSSKGSNSVSNIVALSSSDDIDCSRSPTLAEFNTEPKNVDTQAILRRISKSYQGFLAGEAQEVVLPDDDESIPGASTVAGDGESEVLVEQLLYHKATTGMEPTSEYVLFTNGLVPVGGLEPVQGVVEAEMEDDQLKESQLEQHPVADPPAIPAKHPYQNSISFTSPSTIRTNFSRPLSYQAPVDSKPPSRPSTANTILPSTSLEIPTILEASTTDNAVINFAAISPTRATHHARQYSLDDTASIAESIAASTIAPSEMSARWFQSPRERLGLGGRIKKNEQLPWEMPIGERDASDKKSSKRNRLSMFAKSAA